VILEGRTILVTGGTGSLGQVLVRRVLSGELGTPRKVVVLSRDEAKQHAMRLSYLHKSVTTDEVIYRNFSRALEFRIGDVRSYHDVCSALRDADFVVNAAALKQVPTCEYFPDQAVMTNCLGAVNITRAIREHDYPVRAVVAVSTDKACKPVNVMGMTKALQERIVVAANIGRTATRFMVVRYGNVLASRGSVIPLFHSQIEQGGPVTVTTPEMTRFLVTLEEAVDMVFRALREGGPGETLVPITPSATVMNIAAALVGERDVEIEVTGIRPGEKLHEVLVSEEECNHTTRQGRYYVIAPMLPELASSPAAREAAASVAGEAVGGDLKGEYSSADDVVDLDETIALLERNRLLVGQVRFNGGVELLR
jgi:FlaA1/EpsC-like NDP-sugar epimerase